MAAGGSLFIRGYSQQRAAAIAANASLQERELLKLATLGATAASALRARGVTDSAATVAAEAAITVFKLAFERWIADPPSGDFRACSNAVFEELRTLTA